MPYHNDPLPDTALQDYCRHNLQDGRFRHIIEAAKYAKENNIIVIGVSGFNGGRLKELSDYSAHIKNDSYEVCEDIHTIFGHFLAVYLREEA